MEANKCDTIIKGTPCSWHTLINGETTRFTGLVKRVPEDKKLPFEVEGIDINGIKHKDTVYLNDPSFEVYPPFKTYAESKLSHELGLLLHTLGTDVLNKHIELKLDDSVSDLYFTTPEELMKLSARLYTYEIEAWKIARLCTILHNLLSGKDNSTVPTSK